jgi:hypothetical protein
VVMISSGQQLMDHTDSASNASADPWKDGHPWA